MFSQLLKLFPRTEFQALVKRTHAERHARGFTCWGQFVAMLFCQLGRAHSLREICGGLRSSEGKLQHLGITAPATPCSRRWNLAPSRRSPTPSRQPALPSQSTATGSRRGKRPDENALGRRPGGSRLKTATLVSLLSRVATVLRRNSAPPDSTQQLPLRRHRRSHRG